MAKKHEIEKRQERRFVAVYSLAYAIGCWYILFMSFHHFTIVENLLAIILFGIGVFSLAWINFLLLKKYR